LLGLLLACGLGGCATTPATRVPVADALLADTHLLDFLEEGKTPKETVLLKLGQPSAVMESGRILTYRIGLEPHRGHFGRERAPADWAGASWAGVKYSLVLIFDAGGILQRHSLVEVR